MATLHTYSNRHIKNQVSKIMKGDSIFLENQLSRKRWSLYFKYNNIDENSLNITYVSQKEFTELEDNMKFNVIPGNPPYQDGKQAGQQNKIYNQISKKALTLLADDGIMTFITPTSVCKKSKRFSIIGIPGLKIVDFTAGDHFTVGINICSWTIDKSYTGDVSVICNSGTTMVPSGSVIYNYDKIDLKFIKIYEDLKVATNHPSKRMFSQNTVASNDRRDTKIGIYKYPIYKHTDGENIIVKYNKPTPKLLGKKKFLISRTKGFNEGAIVISKLDFDVAYMFIDIKNKTEAENIRSFLFSDYFIEHSEKWKKLDGYGFNDSLIYLPPFDKTKHWTNNEVREFIESFAK